MNIEEQGWRASGSLCNLVAAKEYIRKYKQPPLPRCEWPTLRKSDVIPPKFQANIGKCVCASVILPGRGSVHIGVAREDDERVHEYRECKECGHWYKIAVRGSG